MKEVNLNEKLLYLLRTQIPQKKECVAFLADLLRMEKGSIYRRVRGDVPFTLQEAAVIAKEAGISLDQLIDYFSPPQFNPYTEKPSKLNISREEANLIVLRNYANKIGEISTCPASEHGHVFNFFPVELAVSYPHLLKFIIFRFLHLFGDNAMLQSFESYTVSPKIQEELYRLEYYLRQIGATSYIWDPSIVSHTVDNIHYFMDMNLIQPQEATCLKKDLFSFLEDLERDASEGQFPSGKRFDLYIAGIHIGFTHSYLCSDSSYMNILMSYMLQPITLFDRQSCLQAKNRFNCLRKLSTLISEVGIKERIQFFKEEHKIVERL
ncbi:hypothetical protein M2137_001686 [Parabacteroides sp. PFB2-10]|uniref:helix-turn-helix domain-containing protein n=1 Tax=Parabacteroides sp. PFB2-10 TaxID=1742405 RepID=UPI002472F565|nr:helix-turn-helix domain-containing protein [Parabacteroides sp. PFB2-10]MDH6312901.1 hypothetical protein [Parabacteroides sp. PFB2-10]